ncbi:hypothetical protein [Actinomadura sp. NPDC000600]
MEQIDDWPKARPRMGLESLTKAHRRFIGRAAPALKINDWALAP